MASALSKPANLPTRRRRDSSDDFGAHSLGSIAGSEVGSSVGDGSDLEALKPKEVPEPSSATGVAAPEVGQTSETPVPTKDALDSSKQNLDVTTNPPSPEPPKSVTSPISHKPLLESKLPSQETPEKPPATKEPSSETSIPQISTPDAPTLDQNPSALDFERASPTLMGASLMDTGNISGSLLTTSIQDVSTSPADTKAPPSPSSNTADNKPVDSLDILSVASKGSGSVSSSRRPIKKRLGSVDFTLASDEDQVGSKVGDESRPLKKRKGSVDFTPASDEGSALSPLRGEDFRVAKKRKGSVDFSLALDEHIGMIDDTKILPLMDSVPSVETLAASEGSGIFHVKGSHSVGSSQTQGLAISALDHLDALGEEAGVAASKILQDEKLRKESIDSNSSHGTFTSSGGRILMEAFMSYGQNDHGHESTRARRDRLESWGGMSDLSLGDLHDSSSSPLVSSCTATAAALAAQALEYTSLANDLTAVADGMSLPSFSVGEGDSKPSSVPSKISLNRMRLDSVASAATEPSAALFQIPADGDLSSDLQAFVSAAVASVGDQLAEIATAVESAIAPHDIAVLDSSVKDVEVQSDMSSAASPLIGAASDNCSRGGSRDGRSRSLSVSSPLNISVDYDAVAAAVDAAEAATGAIDLSALSVAAAATSETDSTSVTSRGRRRQLPTQKTAENSNLWEEDANAISKQRSDDRDMEIIRERARAAAGYVPPSTSPEPVANPAQSKKRVRKTTPAEPQTPDQRPIDTSATPRISNVATKIAPSTPAIPIRTPPTSSAKSTPSKAQSSQKWDSMFDCLVQFIAERREEDIKGLSEKEIEQWTWDGNVPTTYKTKDGKALGRWVNNQRSAKSKGVLKEDREERLVNAGLKWSVLASNSWNEMLEELRIYVNEQTKEGGKWDGNVPTNYRIKPRAGGKLSDEDKNLGRWVNRQRSLYQSGKLRKDRQLALEKVGLKWSMLATTSWESMYDTLCDYVEAKKKADGEWDGNVPANYRTSDNPPRALGRWINRQRSAYVKDKLKAEYIEKLNLMGLKWSVHERRPVSVDPVPSGDANDAGKPSASKASSDCTDGQKAAAASSVTPTSSASAVAQKAPATDTPQKHTIAPDAVVSDTVNTSSSGNNLKNNTDQSDKPAKPAQPSAASRVTSASPATPTSSASAVAQKAPTKETPQKHTIAPDVVVSVTVNTSSSGNNLKNDTDQSDKQAKPTQPSAASRVTPASASAVAQKATTKETPQKHTIAPDAVALDTVNTSSSGNNLKKDTEQSDKQARPAPDSMKSIPASNTSAIATRKSDAVGSGEKAAETILTKAQGSAETESATQGQSGANIAKVAKVPAIYDAKAEVKSYSEGAPKCSDGDAKAKPCLNLGGEVVSGVGNKASPNVSFGENVKGHTGVTIEPVSGGDPRSDAGVKLKEPGLDDDAKGDTDGKAPSSGNDTKSDMAPGSVGDVKGDIDCKPKGGTGVPACESKATDATSGSKPAEKNKL